MPYTTPDVAYWLALAKAPGVGPERFAHIQQLFPTLDALFAPSIPTLPDALQALIPYLKKPDWTGVERDLAWAKQADCHILTWQDASYPDLLREISHAPPLLYVQGDVALLRSQQIAMVGSRNPSASGRENAYYFAQSLVTSGLTITSGLAIGIDAASHQGALAKHGKTIAVLGTGIDVTYPAKHRQLAEQIIAQGALVSEFPLGTPPMPAHFPRRNRLISGLSLGTLVVEAALQSGSLITAHCALAQNREVFAIPGSIHNPLAKGCHRLLKQGAKLVESVNDILEEFRLPFCTTAKTRPPPALSLAQQSLLACIGDEATPLDLVISRSGLTTEAVSSMLLELELQGFISFNSAGYSRLA